MTTAHVIVVLPFPVCVCVCLSLESLVNIQAYAVYKGDNGCGVGGLDKVENSGTVLPQLVNAILINVVT